MKLGSEREFRLSGRLFGRVTGPLPVVTLPLPTSPLHPVSPRETRGRRTQLDPVPKNRLLPSSPPTQVRRDPSLHRHAVRQPLPSLVKSPEPLRNRWATGGPDPRGLGIVDRSPSFPRYIRSTTTKIDPVPCSTVEVKIFGINSGPFNVPNPPFCVVGQD